MLHAAIYGMGRWGGRLIDSVKDSDKIRLVKGVTRNPAAHRELAAKTGLELIDSYEAVLRDPKIDAVVLATPHSAHFEQIVQAAKAGKHVYVEKPLTLTRDTAQQAVDAVKAAGITLSIGFNRRHAPAFLEMKRRIQAGDIGKVLHMEAHQAGPTAVQIQGRHVAQLARRGAGRRDGCARHSHARRHDSDRRAGAQRVRLQRSARRDARRRDRRHDLDAAEVRFGRDGLSRDDLRDRRVVARPRLRIERLDRDAQPRRPVRVCAQRRAGEDHAAGARPRAGGAGSVCRWRASGQRFVVPADQAVNGIAVLEAIVASAESGKPVQIA